MAKLIFSLQEAVEILKENDFIPEKITDIETKGDSISFKADIKMPIIKSVSIPITLKYVGFEKGNAIFEMILPLQKLLPMNKIVTKLADRFSEKIPGAITINYPKIFADFNAVISNKVNGIKVEDFVCKNGEFMITTLSN